MMLEALHLIRHKDKRSIFAVLESMVVKVISHPDIEGRGIGDSCFLNVNSPEDLQMARNLLNR
jgi:molybdopterin-guanine dinucleotide biosynthesis protein A